MLLYDVSDNTCKVEEHAVDGRTQRLFVDRQGATRAFGVLRRKRRAIRPAAPSGRTNSINGYSLGFIP